MGKFAQTENYSKKNGAKISEKINIQKRVAIIIFKIIIIILEFGDAGYTMLSGVEATEESHGEYSFYLSATARKSSEEEATKIKNKYIITKST